MKIATWNMGYWKYKSYHDEAWNYLTKEIKPDIALLQETRPPLSFESNSFLYNSIGGTRNWGSAIYTRDLPVREIPIDDYKGWVVACEVLLPDNSEVIVISIHAQIIKGYVFPNLSNVFAALSPILQDRQFIVGGDLNSCRLIDKVQRTKYHTEFFDRIESTGFFNCHRKFHADEQQTFWGGNIKYPYQDDHLFVSECLAEQVISCDVLDNKSIRKLSDHIPVLMEINI